MSAILLLYFSFLLGPTHGYARVRVAHLCGNLRHASRAALALPFLLLTQVGLPLERVCVSL